jgi:hypothetical protein
VADTAATEVKGRWYPVFGIGNPDIEIKANFGPDNFKFDFKSFEPDPETGSEALSKVESRITGNDDADSVASVKSFESYDR